MSEDLNQVQRVRREKLDLLRDRGINPFPYAFKRSHMAADAASLFEDAEGADDLDEGGHHHQITVAGRMMSFRSHGKSAFAHLEDPSGRIQLYFKKDVIGEELFSDLDLLDLGDWVGVSGSAFRTRTGEVTVRVEKWEILSKSLRALPLGKFEVDAETGERTEHNTFSDTEARYRQRYADLAVHPEVRDTFRLRSKMVSALRSFLDAKGYLEVETPVLQPIYGGASARPFQTHHNSLNRELFLRIADELYLKRLIVGGFEKVYEIAKDFRNDGIDRFHNPEFTMLEFYEAFADYNDMMDLVEEMLIHVVREVVGKPIVQYQGTDLSFAPPFSRISFLKALGQEMGVDPMALSEDELRSCAKDCGIGGVSSMGRGKLLDKLFEFHVEPSLISPTFVMDHPLELSPLAKPHRSEPGVVERFELYVAGMELANAFSELNDPIDQRARFEDQLRLRDEGDDEAQALDEDYLRAMEYGMPPTGGVGVGVDRLAMLMSDQASIREVILFPTLRDSE